MKLCSIDLLTMHLSKCKNKIVHNVKLKKIEDNFVLSWKNLLNVSQCDFELLSMFCEQGSD